MEDKTEHSLRTPGLDLLAASGVALFQELAFIRWLPAEVRVAGYFPNLILIAAFLGLGLGSLKARSKSLLWLWPLSVLAVVGAGVLLGRVAFTAEGISEHLWLLYEDIPEARVVDGIRLPILTLFGLTMVSFVPLGQIVGARLQAFRDGGHPLRGYATDLGGSLLGVLIFAWVSYGSLRPIWWFAPFLILGGYLARGRRRLLVLHWASAAVVLTAVVMSDDAQRYSPYYALSSVASEGLPDIRIRANGALHQVAVDLTEYELGSDLRRQALDGYRIPHRAIGRPIRKALVLGAGTGNDVAVLLDEGVPEIHAVEIDPGIIQMGRDLHPNQPYSDPRVTIHNLDARSFLNETEERFDLIVFGTLDSMTRLSALSNVRLDNFVYTTEALAAARNRLTEDGGMALYFMVGKPYIMEHLIALLARTFGRLPRVEQGEYSVFNTVFLAGPGFEHILDRPPEEEAQYMTVFLPAVDVPSDDWPYLYLESRSVTPFYLSMMALLALFSALVVFGSSREMRQALTGKGGADLEMLLYGLAFLLIETKFVTAMNLLWGATWITSAVVFGSILLTILIATLFADRRPIGWKISGAGLVLALLAVYAIPLQALAQGDAALRLLLSAVYVGTPVFFAALCFADRFRVRESANVAFGWNLLGAVFGGLLEFLSMSLGFSALTLVAVVAYMGAFLLGAKAEEAAPVEAG